MEVDDAQNGVRPLAGIWCPAAIYVCQHIFININCLDIGLNILDLTPPGEDSQKLTSYRLMYEDYSMNRRFLLRLIHWPSVNHTDTKRWNLSFTGVGLVWKNNTFLIKVVNLTKRCEIQLARRQFIFIDHKSANKWLKCVENYCCYYFYYTLIEQVIDKKIIVNHSCSRLDT